MGLVEEVVRVFWPIALAIVGILLTVPVGHVAESVVLTYRARRKVAEAIALLKAVGIPVIAKRATLRFEHVGSVAVFPGAGVCTHCSLRLNVRRPMCMLREVVYWGMACHEVAAWSPATLLICARCGEANGAPRSELVASLRHDDSFFNMLRKRIADASRHPPVPPADAA